jgi:uncharacterized membrane protein
MAAKRPGNWMILGGIAGATAAAYFLDCQHGSERRARFARNAERLASAAVDGVSLGFRDTGHRLVGKARHVWLTARRDQVDDRILAERIRSRMGRILTHPHKVQVVCDKGVVTLWGEAPQDEVLDLTQAVAAIAGVKEVLDHLEVHESPIPPAREEDALVKARHAIRLNWSPWQRLLASVAGAAISAYGWRRKDKLGTALSLIGSGLATQAWMKQNVNSLLAFSEQYPGFSLERTVKINAPISDLYDFWCNPENYPRVFSHISSIERMGENLYRWTITGPAGIPIHWDGMIIRTVPNTLVEWKSLPGSTVGNFGVARFDANYDASTRIDIRMFYRPPAGIMGRFLAELLGANPKQVLDQDLARLKRIFESDENFAKKLKEGGDEQLLKIATT